MKRSLTPAGVHRTVRRLMLRRQFTYQALAAREGVHVEVIKKLAAGITYAPATSPYRARQCASTRRSVDDISTPTRRGPDAVSAEAANVIPDQLGARRLRKKTSNDLGALGQRYHAAALTNVNRGKRAGQMYMARVDAFTAEVQAAKRDRNRDPELTPVELSLVRRAADLDTTLDSHELKLLTGQELDPGAFTQAINSYVGVLNKLGLPRPQRQRSAIA